MTNQRGRKSAAALQGQLEQAVASIERPEPPKELTAEQAEEWRAVTGRLKPDWFGRETHALLAQYCRHVVAAQKIARLVDETPAEDVENLDRLLRMQEREGRAMSSLATRLRITPQSTYDPKKSKLDKSHEKPWLKR